MALLRGHRITTLLAFGAVCTVGILGGAALGAFTIGTFSRIPTQSSATGAPQPPPGVSYVLAEATVIGPSSTPPAGSCTTPNLGTSGSPILLSDGNSTLLCLSTSATGFQASDVVYLLEIAWNRSALTSAEYKVAVAVSVTPSTNDVLATSFVKSSPTITVNETAVYALDLTQAGDTALNQYSVIVTLL